MTARLLPHRSLRVVRRERVGGLWLGAAHPIPFTAETR